MNRAVWRCFGIVLWLASACSVAQAQEWRNSPAVQKLYEAAKKEGTVTVWGHAALEVEWIPAAFGKIFPGIEVKILGENDIATKAIAEYRAGRHQIDVYMTSYTAGRPVLERSMFKKNDWSPFGIKSEDIVFDGQGAHIHGLVFSVIYNKTLVKPEDAPKAWLDLLDPKYKDKMVATTFLLPRLIGPMAAVWGEEKMLQFVRDLMNTGILVTRSPPENFLQSGERLFAIGNFESQAKQWALNGLPVDAVMPYPFLVPQFYVAVMDKAPNPNAAALLAGYLASLEGIAAGKSHNFQGNYAKSSSDPVAQIIARSGQPAIYDDLAEIAKRDGWIAKANSIIAGQVR